MAEGKASTQGPGALTGLKVIDLTRVLGGPYCTMVLSDHGAEVIKLEPPQGDETGNQPDRAPLTGETSFREDRLLNDGILPLHCAHRSDRRRVD